MTAQKRAEMRDCMMSVIAHEKRKKKKARTDDKADSNEEALANLTEAFGLMMMDGGTVQRPIDKPLETIVLNNQIVGQSDKTNEHGELIKNE